MLNRWNRLHGMMAALAVLAACDEPAPRTSGSQVEDEVALDFLVDDGELTVLAVYPLEEWVGSAARGKLALRYELRGLDGAAIVSGGIPDPRIRHREGGPPVTASAGVGSLRLPTEPGVLVILEGDRELGRADFDPAQVAWQGIEGLEDDPAEARIADTATQRRAGPGLGGAPLAGASDIERPRRIFGKLSTAEAADILFLPEGFEKSKLPAFRRRATTIAREMLRQLSTQRNFRPRFNVWVQEVSSNATGLDDEKANRRVDTAFDGIIKKDGDWLDLSGAGWAKVRGLARGVGADVVIVLVNSPKGRGGTYAEHVVMSPIGSNQPAELVHEIGHALLGLADEYDYGGPPCNKEKTPNVSFTFARFTLPKPWHDRLSPGVLLPTRGANSSRRTVGAFEGAGLCKEGRYRSQLGCRMRGLDRGFCGVCLAAFEHFFQTHRPSSTPGNSPCDQGTFRSDGVCDTCFANDPDCSANVCGDGVCAASETDESCGADCGCAASGCDLAPFGCYCDPGCEEKGDCCSDAEEVCPAG